MFSPRIVVACALLAAVAAIPATDKPTIPQPVTTITEDDLDDSPWFSFPLFGNLFAPLWKLLPSFGEIGPKIVSDENNFKVIVNVKDYKKDDLKVKVKNGFIFVQGTHEAKQDDRDVFASQFFHTYTLPVNSSGSDVTAQLFSDGVLVVTAPLNGRTDRTKDSDRDVPIVESATPYQKEDAAKERPTTAQSIGVTAEEDDRKEPTTPSDREDVTEKDNVIPHGNEIPL